VVILTDEDVPILAEGPLMVRFEGEKVFAQSPALLWSRLTDLPFLLTCLPDLGRVENVSAEEATFVLRPSLAFIRGTLNAHMSLVEKTPESEARFRLEAKGIGSSSTVEATLTLVAKGEGTLLRYVAEITQLGGLLKMVPSGLIRGAAQKVVADVLTSIEKKLAN
jgi:carbon monoxide dehydrogenase subunit G